MSHCNVSGVEGFILDLIWRDLDRWSAGFLVYFFIKELNNNIVKHELVGRSGVKVDDDGIVGR